MFERDVLKKRRKRILQYHSIDTGVAAAVT
jgi:hypothetical protein